jgi:flagellar motor switch/type III secretory pathway protein FliN
LPLGSVVELDRPADAPIDLYVNGLRFAQGHLIVTDDGEWAFQCDTVGGRAIPEASSREAPAADVFDASLEAPEVTAAVDEAPEVVDEVAEAPEVAETGEAAETEEAAEAEEAEPTDEPEDVIAAEIPADTPEAPSTPNQEGAVD